MFSTTLRASPIWSPTIPLLKSSPHFLLESSALQTHDIALPTPTPPNGHRLLLLLLSARDTATDPARKTTLARIERLVAAAGGRGVGVVWLLAGSARGYAEMGELLLRRLPHPPPPVLPLADPRELPRLLGTLLLARPPGVPVGGPARGRGRGLLPLLTTTPPLSEHAANVLSDLFPSVRHLAVAVGAREGREVVRAWLGGEGGEGVVEFWVGGEV
ncbi:hypothetical protein FGG08_006800, partial [Glutinoglossum americanum]